MSVSVVSVVLVPALSYDLTTLDIAKDELKITDSANDEWLGRAITQVSILVQSYVKRPLAAETIRDTFYTRRHWYHSGGRTPSGVMPLQLSRWPVISVAEIDEATASGTQALTSGQDYVVDGKAGQLFRLAPLTGGANWAPARNWEAQNVVVTYGAGYQEIPADIVDATLRLVVNRWHARGRDPLLLERIVPTQGTERWWVGGPKGGGTLPSEVQGMLDLYRVPNSG